MRRFVVLASLVLAASWVNAQTKRAPWQWTVEERIAIRTDPAAARERLERGGPRVKADASPGRAAIADRYDGKSHPELFLPHQVFHELVMLAFASNARTEELVRAGFMTDVRRHGLPGDFWLRLEALSSAYLADRRALEGLLRTEANTRRHEQALALKQRDVCRTRADALSAARREFGQERFDRFLYDVIAVNMFTVSDKVDDAEVLRQAVGSR
jgi:hypothetical protein